MPALLLILDSLGTSEMLLILVVALIFFGPRKLPQISRQIGKTLAELRRASEDFKHTWEREVAVESTQTEDSNRSILAPNSYPDATVGRGQALNHLPEPDMETSVSAPETAAAQTPFAENSSASEPATVEPAPKRDWL